MKNGNMGNNKAQQLMIAKSKPSCNSQTTPLRVLLILLKLDFLAQSQLSNLCFSYFQFYLLQLVINLQYNSIMQLSSQFPQFPPNRNQSSEEFDDKQSSHALSKLSRTRKIKKNNPHKNRNQPLETTINEPQKTLNITSPFGVFQTQIQKKHRLQHYFKLDIDNYYKTQVNQNQIEQLENLVGENCISLATVLEQNAELCWNHLQPSCIDIYSYLELINKIENKGSCFSIIGDQSTDQKYCAFYSSEREYQFVEITSFEESLIKNRDHFRKLFLDLKQTYTQKVSKQIRRRSQLKKQIIYLYKQLCQSTTKLDINLSQIKKVMASINEQEGNILDSPSAQDQYLSYLYNKLLRKSLSDKPIDQWNIFLNNEARENGEEIESIKITSQKKFQEYIKRKKSRKVKKARFLFYSGCLGCLNDHFETYNPFLYCHQCYVRFHRSCYPGFIHVDENTFKEEIFCESCYYKKFNHGSKPKYQECLICGIKGILSLTMGNNQRIHVFCALANGLWSIRNKELKVDAEQYKVESRHKKIGKCEICHLSGPFVENCCDCFKNSHIACAFFNGWEINIDKSNGKSVVSMTCCKLKNRREANERRRKYIVNYKKIAYNCV